MLRVISGLLTPDAGRVAVLGHDTVRDAAVVRRKVSYLSAGSTALYARLTVRQHLLFWARVSYVPRARRAAVVDGVLRDLALAELSGRRLDRLSSGQRQRVRLALAFIPAAGLLLLDEPATSLDAEGRALLAQAIGRHIAGGTSVLWCAPDREPELAPDLHLVMSAGTLVAA